MSQDESLGVNRYTSHWCIPFDLSRIYVKLVVLIFRIQYELMITRLFTRDSPLFWLHPNAYYKRPVTQHTAGENLNHNLYYTIIIFNKLSIIVESGKFVFVDWIPYSSYPQRGRRILHRKSLHRTALPSSIQSMGLLSVVSVKIFLYQPSQPHSIWPVIQRFPFVICILGNMWRQMNTKRRTCTFIWHGL
jgi:hypothetical protein